MVFRFTRQGTLTGTSDHLAAFYLATLYPITLSVALFIAAITSNLSYAGEAATGQVLTEEMAVNVAIRDNPSLAALQARYQALKEIPSQQGALPDPVLSLNALNLPSDTFHVGEEAMTQMQIGISQSFPFPGKLKLKEAASEFDAQAAGYAVDELRLHLINNIKHGWWQLFYVDRALDTVASNQSLMRNFIQVALTKYEVGDGLQQDVLLAQLELSKLQDQKIQLTAVRRGQAIGLNVLMDVAPHSEVTLPTSVSEQMPAIADEHLLYQRAEASRPLLKKISSHIDAAQSRLSLSEKNYYPDFKLGLAYGDRAGDDVMGDSRSDLISVRLSMNVPIYTERRQSKAVRQRSLELAQNRYTLQDEAGAVRAAIAQATTHYQRAQQQFALFKGGHYSTGTANSFIYVGGVPG